MGTTLVGLVFLETMIYLIVHQLTTTLSQLECPAPRWLSTLLLVIISVAFVWPLVASPPVVNPFRLR